MKQINDGLGILLRILLILVISFLLLGCASYIEKKTQEETERITKEITAGTDRKVAEKVIPVLGKVTGKTINCDHTLTKRQFTFNPYYSGPLIDSHLHMPVATEIVSNIAEQSGFESMPSFEDVSLDHIVCISDSEGITKSFGFFLMTTSTIGSDIQAVKESVQNYPEKFAPFYMPNPIASINPSPAEAEKIVTENNGLFQGLGEIKFDHDEVQNANPEDPEFLELYGMASRHQQIVMIHPKPTQLAELEHLLQKYPKVIFLVHGFGNRYRGTTKQIDIGKLMGNYPNLYYSLDAEMTAIFGFIGPRHNPTREEYVAWFENNFDSVLTTAITEWKTLVEAHPDRFLWGTDKWYEWHFDREVGALIEEFSRSFIGKLDLSVQEKFAYKNAERLLREK